MLVRVLLALLITGWLATPALAKEYQADRFDVRIDVLPGGHLHVTETIVFRFVEGTFREVFRTVPSRRTDGIEFVSASMDGTVLPQGDGPGTLRAVLFSPPDWRTSCPHTPSSTLPRSAA